MGVKLSKDVLQQVEELEEGIIKEEILPALGNDIAPRLEPIKRDLVLVVEYHPGEPISVALSRKTKISEIMGAKTLTPRSSTPVKSEGEPTEVKPHEPTKHIEISWQQGTAEAAQDGININSSSLPSFRSRYRYPSLIENLSRAYLVSHRLSCLLSVRHH